jgi:hypothetical protein
MVGLRRLVPPYQARRQKCRKESGNELPHSKAAAIESDEVCCQTAFTSVFDFYESLKELIDV